MKLDMKIGLIQPKLGTGGGIVFETVFYNNGKVWCAIYSEMSHHNSYWIDSGHEHLCAQFSDTDQFAKCDDRLLIPS